MTLNNFASDLQMPVLFINHVMQIYSLSTFHLLLCMQVLIQTIPWDLNKRRKTTILAQLMCMQVDSFLQLVFHTDLFSLPQKDASKFVLCLLSINT